MKSNLQAAAILITVFGFIQTDAHLVWSEWSACSVTCGRGVESRTCLPAGQCQEKETRYCTRGVCSNSNHCNLWSECSVSCGGGVQTMTKCERGEKIIKICNIEKCPSEKTEVEEVCPTEGVPIKYRPTENICCRPTGAQCGKINNNSRKKIASLAGRLYDDEQLFPWSVAVLVGSVRCGGVMISQSHVLTAASCVSLPIQPRSVSVLRGAAYKWNRNYAGDRKVVKNIIIHPSFVRQIEYDNNVAILELDGTFDDQPVCLPRGEEIAVGSTCVVADFEQASPYYLKHISNDFDIANFEACEDHYQPFNFTYLIANELLNKEKMLCGWRSSSIKFQPRTCKGTTGAPLLCQRCSTCQWVLQGIVSYSGDSCYPFNRPALFTKLSKFETWISESVDLGYVDNAPTCT